MSIFSSFSLFFNALPLENNAVLVALLSSQLLHSEHFDIFWLPWTPILEHHIHASGKRVEMHSLVLSNKYHLSLRAAPPALEPVTAREGDETKNQKQTKQQQKNHQRESKMATSFHIDNNRNWESYRLFYTFQLTKLLKAQEGRATSTWKQSWYVLLSWPPEPFTLSPNALSHQVSSTGLTWTFTFQHPHFSAPAVSGDAHGMHTPGIQRTSLPLCHQLAITVTCRKPQNVT